MKNRLLLFATIAAPIAGLAIAIYINWIPAIKIETLEIEQTQAVDPAALAACRERGIRYYRNCNG